MSAQERIVPLAIVILVLVAIGAIAMMGGWDGILQKPATPEVPVSVEADIVDPLNEGRLVSVQGRLGFKLPAFDQEMGVSDADAVVLFRHVEMYQWQETCIADACTQSSSWSPELIDATQFKEQLGNLNPDEFPFASQAFFAEGVFIGAFAPDLDLVAREVPMLPKRVTLGDLPANLAASFSERDGWIIAGNDLLNPAVGDLRINYRMVSAGVVTLIGRQVGNRLVAEPAN
ncbi:TMEM43 family protein [Dokdonella sp.]|uniref:TMEM43 family protein n=1 Tax=Dokdonella sp. TaxID=2291710 RepID=UPI0035273F11